MRANIKLPLYKLTPLALLMLLRNVGRKFTGNPLFTGSPVTVLMMESLGDELEKYILLGREGSLSAKEAPRCEGEGNGEHAADAGGLCAHGVRG